MQTLTKFKHGQSSGKYLPIDVIASKAEKPSRLVLVVAVICMVSIRFRELALAYGAAVLLKLQQINDELFRKAGTAKARKVAHAALKVRIFLMTGKQAITRGALGVQGRGVLLALRDSLGFGVEPRSAFFDVRALFVCGPAFVALIYGLLGHGSVALAFAYLLPIPAIELAVARKIFFPFFGRAFRFFHASILSNRLIFRAL